MSAAIYMPRLGPFDIKDHPLYLQIAEELRRAVEEAQPTHDHFEKVEREFEERILEWQKGPKTRERWDELEFKTVGRHCNGTLIPRGNAKVAVERDVQTIGWKVVASCGFRCTAAPMYHINPDVIQYAAKIITERDLRLP